MRKVLIGAVALAGGVVLALGGNGTFALWNDSAQITGGSFTSGKLDLTVDGAQGNPTPYVAASLALTAMTPGESVAQAITVANAGDASFSWVPTVTTGGTLGPALTVTLRLGGQASPVDTTYPRTQACSGGTVLTSGTTATILAQGATAQTLCVTVTLPSSTGDAYQSQSSGSVTVAIAATQV
jgi:alternate signal-mediated exported protein